MEQTVSSADVVQPEQVVFPYRPSWIDRLTAWVARRPGPAWLYYLGAAALLYAAYILVKWQEGNVPSSMISLWTVMVAVTGFYYLATIHYRDEIARDAMERFRPAIDAPKWRVAELEYRLTTMPPKMVWLMTFLGIIEGSLTLAGIASGALTYPGPPAFVSLPASILEVVIILAIGIFFVNSIYHTIYQLWTVSKIYTELTNVNIFQQAPLHAFARLAAYTAIGWIIPQYFWLTAGLEAAAFGIALSFLSIVMAMGVLIFTWPLLGIHRLLDAEKEKLQSTANTRLQNCLLAFDQAIEKGDLTQMDALNKAIDNAERECRIIDALPTWPWQQGMLRGAVTAILLPLVLWVVTRLLERVFGP